MKDDLNYRMWTLSLVKTIKNRFTKKTLPVLPLQTPVYKGTKIYSSICSFSTTLQENTCPRSMMAAYQLKSMIAIRKTKEKVSSFPNNIKKSLQEDLRVIHENTMDLELEIVDLRIELLNAGSRLQEAKTKLPEDIKTALETKWKSIDNSIFKDIMQKDGSIRNVDDIEYERMLALVESMKRPDYKPTAAPANCSKLLNTIQELESNSKLVPSATTTTTTSTSTTTSTTTATTTPGTSSMQLDCLKDVKNVRQSKITFKTDDTGEKRLRYELKKDSEQKLKKKKQ